MRLFLIILGAAGLSTAVPALAQDDAPTATRPVINTPPPPPGQAPATQTPAPKVEETPVEARPVTPPQLLFISPMGEPFRAKPGQPYPVDQWFKQADQGAKGYITLDDFKADALRFFKVLDENGDGIIDGFEAQDYEAKIAPEILPRISDTLSARDVMTQHELAESGHRKRRPEDSVGAGDGRSSKGAAGRDAMSGASIYGLLADPEPVKSADTKLDYHITRDEWLAAAAHRFQELDKDHTGKLELAKLPHTPLQKAIEEQKKGHDGKDEHKGERGKDAHDKP